MIKLNSTIFAIGLFFSLSANALGASKVCSLDLSQSKFESSGCTQISGVTIWKLALKNLSIYPGTFESLPTLILKGDNLDAIRNLMKGGGAPYNGFIELPALDRIQDAKDATAATRKRMGKEGWRLTNAIDILYEGPNEYDGPGLLCGTYDRKTASGYIVISQCNSGYEEDRTTLNGLLNLVEDQLK